MEFVEFGKIARLSRECVITEKIDGTNAQIYIVAAEEIGPLPVTGPLPVAVEPVLSLAMFAGSRSRYVTPEADNFGFAAWVKANADALWALGMGRHYGEWWGSGIQRGYGLPKGEKRFSLFNVARWHQVGAEPYVSVSGDPRHAPKSSTEAPAVCHVVPVLYRGEFESMTVDNALHYLRTDGSMASPGFTPAEGVVIYHTASGQYFKKTIEKDAEPKSRYAQVPA